MKQISYFTSECVSEGHPDKMCDQISDLVLDYVLSKDKNAHVACECFITTNFLVVGGEIKTTPEVWDSLNNNLRDIITKQLKFIGYTDDKSGFNVEEFELVNKLHHQSADIDMGVSKDDQGAGDQGLMFGFATDETEEFLPYSVVLSTRIIQFLQLMKHSGDYPWMQPDAKSQVTLRIENGIPKGVDTIVISQQHKEGISQEEIQDIIFTKVIKPLMNAYPELSFEGLTTYINPTGQFIIGGPDGDTGLTGRKIIVDTYGGVGRHGGGAFSGKDPSKVDRSAAYMARYIAKNIVAAKIAHVCEVQLSYAIGVSKPTSIHLNTYGALSYEEECEFAEKLLEVFDCTPKGIIETLHLKETKYLDTATLGHFFHTDKPWEKTDKVETLLKVWRNM